MTNTFKLDILSPEGSVFSGQVSLAKCPTLAGEITILAGHTSLITKLSSGEVEIEQDGERKFIAIMGGFLEISENIVSIIADFAMRSDEIDEQKIKEAKLYAEEQLKKKDKISSEIAEHDLQKAVLELKVFEHRKLKNKNKGVKY
ncbi:MAG: ATP synthase F1 subunit epsilon [Endomicrobiaceae bacterium]|nr:ATP synthase F1 subunit epsilon [Endomicrobiaceae bacterium]